MEARTPFDIALSKALSASEVAAALVDLLPKGLRIDVVQDIDRLQCEAAAILAEVNDSDDPAWPCILTVYVCREDSQLTPYPDLRIAGHLWRRFGTDALCDTYSFAGELDPQDPYWALALVEGRWHLASTVHTKLMDERATGSIKLIRDVEVPPC